MTSLAWPNSPLDVGFGFAAAGAAAYIGYRAGALTWSGAVAASLVGGIVYGFGGPASAVLLVIFFVTSSAFSFYKRGDTRKQIASEQFDKGGERDAGQVFANGGAAAAAALLGAVVPDAGVSGFMLGAYCGALAAAAADTWATEIGVLSRHRPRLVTSWKEVALGTSGGVTLLGTAASVVGALFTGGGAVLLALLPNGGWGGAGSGAALLGAALAGGTLGSFVDSFLGATVQASYLCTKCDKVTESRLHRCGTRTTLKRGVRWVNNDIVNTVATVAGGVVGGAVWLLLYN